MATITITLLDQELVDDDITNVSVSVETKGFTRGDDVLNAALVAVNGICETFISTHPDACMDCSNVRLAKLVSRIIDAEEKRLHRIADQV